MSDIDKKTPYKDKRVAEGHLRSFGRIKSRMSIEAMDKLDERLAPYELAVENEKADLTNVGDKPLILEIGIGNGGLVFHRAKHEQDKHFIGVEVFRNGLKTLVNSLEQEEQAENKLTNIQISSEDGRRVMKALPDSCVDMLMVCYPDPWPKKKHNKRRIISPEFLKEADRLVKDGGTLFLATDVPDYAMWMVREVSAQDVFSITVLSPEEWGKEPEWWDRTKYEKKAFKAGRKPWYMSFKKGVERDPDFHRCEALVE